MPELIDTFTFVQEDDNTVRIYQHYEKPTEGGAISTPIGYIRDKILFWTTNQPPLLLWRVYEAGAAEMVAQVDRAFTEITEEMVATNQM